MRILIVSELTGFMRGGVNTAIVQLANGLVASGHTVGLVTDRPIESVIDAQHFPITLPLSNQSQNQVAAAISAFRPDVVHLVAIGIPGLYRLRSVLKAVPLVMSVHSVPPRERVVTKFHSSEAKHYLWRGLRMLPNSLLWRSAVTIGLLPTVIVHSDAVKDDLRAIGLSDSKMHVVPFGFTAPPSIAPTTPTSNTSARKLVTIAGLAHTKGQHDVLTAMAELGPSYSDVNYVMVGQNRDQSYLRFIHSRIQSLGLQNRVTLRNSIPEEEKNAEVQSASIYIQPSHEEGFGLAFLEAAALAPRLLATRTGALPAICGITFHPDEKTVSPNTTPPRPDPAMMIVRPRQPLELAQALRTLFSVPVDENTLTARRLRLLHDFSPQQFVDLNLKVYERVTSNFSR